MVARIDNSCDMKDLELFVQAPRKSRGSYEDIAEWSFFPWLRESNNREARSLPCRKGTT